MLQKDRLISKQALWGAAIIGLMAFGLYYIAFHLTVVHHASAQVKATPFMAELHSYTFETNPAGELLTKKMIARRSDGTTATIHTVGPISKGWTSRKIQYMDGRYTGIVDRVSSILRGSVDSSQLAGLKARLMNPPQNCVVDVSFRLVGNEEVFGRQLAKIVRRQPNGVHTGWYDPALGCEILQSSMEETQPDGSLKLKSRLTTVGLSMSEPDQRLFEEPLSYDAVFNVKELEDRFGAAVQGELPAVSPQR